MKDEPVPPPGPIRRRGVVAVVRQDERFLTIRRSAAVLAPGKYCFPGGGIEAGETEPQALAREMQEELGVSIRAVRCLWRSTTRWHVELAWWLGDLEPQAILRPNPAEVESCHWLTGEEMLALAELLESNRLFLAAIAAGQIDLG